MARSKKVKTPTAEITRRATKGTSELQQKASLNYTKDGNLYSNHRRHIHQNHFQWSMLIVRQELKSLPL